jgi:hypothetical protein
MPQQEQPPMSMAEGGLTTLPLPETMFDEPNNGGYADGGIVAFAGAGPVRGGMSNLYDDVEYWESGGKQSAVSPKGARGVMQLMEGTSRDPGFGIEPTRDGSEAENRRVGQQYLDAMFRRYGDQPTALAAYNWGPGNVDKWLQKGGDPKKLPDETKKYISNVLKGSEPPIRERNTGTAQGFVSSLGDISDVIERRFGKTDEEKALDVEKRARAREMASPEFAAQEAKDSLWGHAAKMFFGAAASDAPDLVTALAKAGAAEIGDYVADKKERKQLKDKALDLMVKYGAEDRKEALEQFKLVVGIHQNQLAQQLAGKELDFKKDELLNRIEQAGFDRTSAEKIASMRTSNPTQFELGMNIIMNGTPDQKLAFEKYIKLTKTQSAVPPFGGGEADGTGGDNSGMSIVGSKPVQ